MKLFHKHQWEIVVETYAPPLGVTRLAGCSEFLAERMMLGLTTVLLKCQIVQCGQTKTVEMLGRSKNFSGKIGMP